MLAPRTNISTVQRSGYHALPLSVVPRQGSCRFWSEPKSGELAIMLKIDNVCPRFPEVDPVRLSCHLNRCPLRTGECCRHRATTRARAVPAVTSRFLLQSEYRGMMAEIQVNSLIAGSRRKSTVKRARTEVHAVILLVFFNYYGNSAFIHHGSRRHRNCHLHGATHHISSDVTALGSLIIVLTRLESRCSNCTDLGTPERRLAGDFARADLKV